MSRTFISSHLSHSARRIEKQNVNYLSLWLSVRNLVLFRKPKEVHIV